MLTKTRMLLCSLTLVAVSTHALPCFGQTALEQLEQRLFGGASGLLRPAEETPEPPSAQLPTGRTPGTGAVYLGFRGESSAEGGIDVLQVDGRGPAKAAGIESGDRILRFDGADVSNLDSLARVVGRVKPGQQVPVRLERRNSQITTTMVIGSSVALPSGATNSPPPSTSTTGRPSLGVSVTPVTDAARRTYGLAVRRGALITSVTRGGASSRAGLTVGSVIVAVDGRQVSKPEDLISTVQRSVIGQTLQLSIYEGSRLSIRRVKLEGVGSAAVAENPTPGGRLENRFGEGGRRPVLGAIGRLLDDVVRDDGGAIRDLTENLAGPSAPPRVDTLTPAPPTPGPVESGGLSARDQQLQLLIEEMRALRLTVQTLQRRVERLESGRDGGAKLDLKAPETPQASESLPAPNSL